MARSPFREQIELRAAFLKEMGLDYGMDRPALLAASVQPSLQQPPSLNAAEPSSADLEPEAKLRAIREEMGDCRRCRLCDGRNKIVFGIGNPRARLMFVGEGPGADEDRTGEPFVGRAGQLLTDIITKGMRLTRQDVYIANIVKCRPPDNRTPLPDEAATCLPFLEAQIDALRPEVIVALGATACQHLLGVQVQITKFRGTWSNFRGIPLMPTFHPSYLLRNPVGAKKLVWQDIQAVMARLGMALPEKP